MVPKSPDTEELLRRVARGDASARSQVIVRHQERLRRMVACRLDRRLAARMDPSDVVQEVLAEADRRLPDYLQRRPLPFYAWLRQIAVDRLIELHRHHVQAQRRSVRREEDGLLAPSDASADALAELLSGSTSSPIQRLLRQEARQRVRAGLDRLSPTDREVLELRHLEQLSMTETAAVLGVSIAAAKTRHLRALRRLRELLEVPPTEEHS